MGYDTISLDPDASKICTINFPWGKYLRLPMGIAGSPDIFQAEMMKLMDSPDFFQDGANGILRVCTSLNR
jgi:hypothetical protein